MNKINKIAVLLFGLILPFSLVPVAHADVASDLANKLSFERVIKNGLNSGLPMSVVLVKIFSSVPEEQWISIVSAAILVSPTEAPLVVRVAIRAGADAEEVVTEAVALAPLDKKAISQSAIASGADVMDVTLASAAGLARSGVTLAKGGALGSLPVTPPVVKGGVVAPPAIPRVNGGRGVPIVPPVTGISQS